MGIQEKRVPKFLSIAAIVGSTIFTGVLWYLGAEEPRKYVSNMTINHHAGYGAALDCSECHIPIPGTYALMTEMGCSTAECHGELLIDTPREVAMGVALEMFRLYEDREDRAAYYLALHEAHRGESCWTCHTEHTHRPTLVPDGWMKYNEMIRANADLGPNEKRLIGNWLRQVPE